MDKIETLQESTLTLEQITAIREGLPRVCDNLAKLVSQRLLEKEVDASLQEVYFETTYTDLETIHSERFQLDQKEALMELEAKLTEEGTLSDVLHKALSELRIYDTLSDHDRKGGDIRATFTLEYPGTDSSGEPNTRVQACSVYSQEFDIPQGWMMNRIKILPEGKGVEMISRPSVAECAILATAVETFEKVEEADVRIKVSVPTWV